MTKHATDTTISEMSIEELQTRAQKAQALLAQVAALLPGLVSLSVEDRKHSNGKFQAGEVPAMKKLLVAAGKHPAVFTSLASKDGGKDAKAFEPQPAIDDLDRVTALQQLASDAESFAQALSDTMLSFGSSTRGTGGARRGRVRRTRRRPPQRGRPPRSRASRPIGREVTLERPKAHKRGLGALKRALLAEVGARSVLAGGREAPLVGRTAFGEPSWSFAAPFLKCEHVEQGHVMRWILVAAPAFVARVSPLACRAEDVGEEVASPDAAVISGAMALTMDRRDRASAGGARSARPLGV